VANSEDSHEAAYTLIVPLGAVSQAISQLAACRDACDRPQALARWRLRAAATEGSRMANCASIGAVLLAETRGPVDGAAAPDDAAALLGRASLPPGQNRYASIES
jgi:hypothetical protein